MVEIKRVDESLVPKWLKDSVAGGQREIDRDYARSLRLAFFTRSPLPDLPESSSLDGRGEGKDIQTEE